MRKITSMICGVILMATSLQAQDTKSQGRMDGQQRRTAQASKVGAGQRAERIQAIKVGHITAKLQLSAEQATAFWPVYNEYERELRDVRRSFRQKYRNGAADESNAMAKKYIEDNLDLQEKTTEIKRKYKDRLLKVISPQQLASLYEAERDFKKMLIKQLRERRGRQ